VGTLAKFGLIALVALALTALPGGDSAVEVTLALLSVVFFTLVALLGYRLYMRFRDDLEGLPESRRWVLYGSIGGGFLVLCATQRLFDSGGSGALLWLALLAVASYGLYWVWGRYRAYG
jgi:hypothetical protein